jgi:homoserine kinase type II
MSVFTTVEHPQLEQFLIRYDLGKACGFRPISDGITNTNYQLETDLGDFVLTLYEHHSDDELDYILGLQQHMAAKSVLCPAPVRDRRGDYYSMLNQRPAAIIHRLPGAVIVTPDAQHCAQVGAELARFHLAGRDYEKHRGNPRGIDWLLAVGDMLDDNISVDDQLLFDSTLREYRNFDYAVLPRGAIHADLFHDNALFVDGQLSGIIDFDYVCEESFAFDIAVLLNDWCIDSRGELDKARVAAMLTAYQAQRRLELKEIQALPLMLQFGALRFWMSRLYDKVFPLNGELTFIKDPAELRELLRLRGSQQDSLQQLFLQHYME